MEAPTKTINQEEHWAFDCEWAPDVAGGRRLYHLPEDMPDADVMQVMWRENGATEEDPKPFLRTILCRVVSIVTLVRKRDGSLHVWRLPENPDDPNEDEKCILRKYLEKLSKNNPVLVGFNSRAADVHILMQRAIVNGLQLPAFCKRAAEKPWNSKDVDLMELIGAHGNKGFNCSLNQLAWLCGIPGKLDTTGDDVADMFYSGQRRAIVDYNTFDAFTTYLVWLRYAYFAGTIETAADYAKEQERVHLLLEAEMAKENGAYLKTFLDAWDSQGANLVK